MRKLAFTLLTWLSLVSPALSQATDGGTIRFATEGAYKPWNFKEADGKLQGFEIDIINEVCGRLRANCTTVASPFDGLIPALNASRFDVIVASLTITARRREAIDFTRPYANSARTFYVTPASSVRALSLGLDDIDLDAIGPNETEALNRLRTALRGKVVGVQVRTTLETFLNKYLTGVVQVRTYDTQENVDLDLEAGRLDVAMANTAYTMPAIKDGKKFTLIGPRFRGDVFGEGQGMGVRKADGQLRARLDATLNAMLADGTLRRLSDKWFGFDLIPVM
ncbi:MAG: transporter substrate-binding domain-containing protein [Aestuariivirga sp.]|uniref:transporter substrate-binding domain-containing protein n=1 Tax=Aestuariivirga sp. TaxID=2650926 RepID=UPI0038D0B7CB